MIPSSFEYRTLSPPSYCLLLYSIAIGSQSGSVGLFVGTRVGVDEGDVDGTCVGDEEGACVGLLDGAAEGGFVGCIVGRCDGGLEGDLEGEIEGDAEGLLVGAVVTGLIEGRLVGLLVEEGTGSVIGSSNWMIWLFGDLEGKPEGDVEGLLVGSVVTGLIVGRLVGLFVEGAGSVGVGIAASFVIGSRLSFGVASEFLLLFFLLPFFLPLSLFPRCFLSTGDASADDADDAFFGFINRLVVPCACCCC